MTPAAYHRIAEDGRPSERFQPDRQQLLSRPWGALAPGIAGNGLDCH